MAVRFDDVVWREAVRGFSGRSLEVATSVADMRNGEEWRYPTFCRATRLVPMARSSRAAPSSVAMNR